MPAPRSKTLLATFAAIVAMSAPLPASGATSASPASECESRLLADLEITMGPGGELLLPAQFGEEPVWIILNTGSSISLLWPQAVERFRLPRQTLAATTAPFYGERITTAARIPALRLGDQVLLKRNAYLAVAPGAAGDELSRHEGRPVVGFLGTRLFVGKLDLEIHFATSRFRLFSARRCPERGAYWSDTYAEAELRYDAAGAILFPMELDGQHVEAVLATGSGVTVIDPLITREYYGFDTQSPGIESGPDGASYRAMSLTTRGMSFDGAPIRLGMASNGCGHQRRKPTRADSGNQLAIAYAVCYGVAPLRLGRDLLSKLRLYIATSEYRVYLTRADAGR